MFHGNKQRTRCAAVVAATVASLLVTAARADEQVFSFQDFEAVPTFTSAPNTSGLGIPGVNFFSYSGLSTLTRTEGIDNDGVGGSHAIFQAYDGAAAASSFFYYSGLGEYFYVDPVIGLPLSTPDKLKLTFDTKGIGQTQDPPQATLRVQIFNDTNNGAAFVAILPLAIDSNYTTQGGTFDTFFPQDADPDFGGPLPAGPSVFNGRNAFQFQIDTGNQGFGFDNGNKLSIDNVKVTVIRPVYHGGAASNYTDVANWSEGEVPNSINAFPLFGANGGVARTVALNSNVTVNRLDFAGTLDDVNSISGSGRITFQGDSPGLIDHEGIDSMQTINVPVTLAKSGTVRVNAGASTINLAGGVDGAGTIRKDRNGRLLAKNLRYAGGLNIVGGSVELQAGIGDNSTSKISSLTIGTAEASANLTLNDARLIIDYTGTSPLGATVTSFKLGDIRGTAATPANQSVAIVDRSELPAGFGNTFGGQSVDSTSLLLELTLLGDATLDRKVNFDDLVILAQKYGTTGGAGWEDGDFNYSGGVDFDDLVPLAQNYNGTFSVSEQASLPSDFVSDFLLAQSLVPEPTTLAALGGAALLAMRRARRG